MPSLGLKIGLSSSKNLSSLDSDAKAFIDTLDARRANWDYTSIGGGDEATTKKAWDTFVKSAKQDGWWNNIVNLFPYIGQEEDCHKTDAAAMDDDDREIAFSGDVTHDAYGVTLPSTPEPNASIAVDINTYWPEGDYLPALGLYTPLDANVYIGARTTADADAAPQTLILEPSGTSEFCGNTNWNTGNPLKVTEDFTGGGFFMGFCPGGLNQSLYRDGTLIASNEPYDLKNKPIDDNLRLNGIAGAKAPTAHNQRFFITLQGITHTNVQQIYSAVQALQLALGRSI